MIIKKETKTYKIKSKIRNLMRKGFNIINKTKNRTFL